LTLKKTATAFFLLAAWILLTPAASPGQALSPEKVVELYGAAWLEPDEQARREILEKAWADDGVYTDPTAEIKGREALIAHIQGFHSQSNGSSIEITSSVDSHHGTRLRFSWAMKSADGKILTEGMDYGELASDGRLKLIVGFFGPFPPIKAP